MSTSVNTIQWPGIQDKYKKISAVFQAPKFFYTLNCDIRDAPSVSLVVYHLHGNSGYSIRKVNGTSIFRRPNRKFSGMNGLFEKVVLSYRLERFNRWMLFHLHFLFFHQFQALRDLIQTGWVFHINGKQPFSAFRSVTRNGKRIIRKGFSIRNFAYH